MNSTYFPHFTIGSDAYDKIPDICGEYGKTAVIIGGTKARIAAEPLIRKAVSGKIDITGSFLYGDDATFENAEALTKIPEIQEADMIFAVGGGRATDTCKWAAHLLKKPIFTFPTLASNCASVTAVCIMYNPDHSFKGSIYRERGAWHTFINTEIIAHSPRQYFWAGLGDALSKQIEVLYCTRGKHLFHTPLLGAQLACACQEPLLQFGRQALDDFRAKTMSDAFTECVLDIIVSTGVVSNLVTHTEYYYNSSLAHCFYNASMVLPSAHAHLHGEVVSFGNLVLLAYDGQDELLERFLDFNTSIGLPVTLAQVGITTDEQLMKLVSAAEHIKEWSTGPEPAVREQFVAAIRKVDTLGAARLAAAA